MAKCSVFKSVHRICFGVLGRAKLSKRHKEHRCLSKVDNSASSQWVASETTSGSPSKHVEGPKDLA